MNFQHKIHWKNRKSKERQTIKQIKLPSTQFCLQEALVLGMGLDVGIKKVGQKQEQKKVSRESPLKDKISQIFPYFEFQ